jgi:hypothetical protein
MRRFVLWRRTDATGVSGPGAIAEGVVFGDGTCSLRWRTNKRSTAVYGSFSDLLAIHGHDGATVPLWLDGEHEGPVPSTAFTADGPQEGVSEPVCWIKSGAMDVHGNPITEGCSVRLLKGKPDSGTVNYIYVDPSNSVMVSVAGVSPCNLDAFPVGEVEVT